MKVIFFGTSPSDGRNILPSVGPEALSILSNSKAVITFS